MKHFVIYDHVFLIPPGSTCACFPNNHDPFAGASKKPNPSCLRYPNNEMVQRQAVCKLSGCLVTGIQIGLFKLSEPEAE